MMLNRSDNVFATIEENYSLLRFQTKVDFFQTASYDKYLPSFSLVKKLKIKNKCDETAICLSERRVLAMKHHN